jgi:hypothetical protein
MHFFLTDFSHCFSTLILTLLLINNINNAFFILFPTLFFVMETCYTVKPDHVVTSIKQSPVLKVHLFLVVL